MNRVSSARIAREEGGRAAALPRSRGVILPPRVRARSRGLSTGARGGRARGRVSGKHPANREDRERATEDVRRWVSSSGRYAPQPLPELPRVLESARGHLEVHAGHDLEGGKRRKRLGRARHGASSPAGYTLSRNARVPPRLAARASTPQGSPDRSRARAAPAEPCPTVRTAVRRARGCGATNTAAPGLARDAGAVAVAHRNSARKSRPSMPSRVGQEKRVDQNLAVRHRWTRFNVQKSYDVLYMGIWSGNATDFLANGSAGFWIHARVANAASRTDTAFLLGRKSRTVVEENATSALQRAVLARAIPTPPTLPIRA